MNEHQLLHLLKKKKSFFETILDITEEESELPISDWICALEQKNILLTCIDEIDTELHPFKSSLSTLSQEINEELENIRKVVKKILHLDEFNKKTRKAQLSSERGAES